MSYDEKYMRRAIELAKKGEGAVNPNPLVGAVIVKDGRIIAEGYHERYGSLHAERTAFANLNEPAEGAEMYVTLEPCCHFGKQPPCTHAIVENKIDTVYVGSDDPNPLVAGKGIEYLREHGIKVHTQALKDDCDSINNVFFHFIQSKTPYVLLKYAMTMDGKIACYTGDSKWVSCDNSRQDVMKLRNKYKGIMVGVGTVLADDPMLTCRMENGRNPIRIVCDTNLRIPLESKVVNTTNEARTIVATAVSESDKINALIKKGVEVIVTNKKDDHIDLKDLMNKLGAMDIDGILLEGGGTLNYSAIMEDVVSEVRIYLAPKLVGGKDSVTPVEGTGIESMNLAKTFSLDNIDRIDNDLILTYRRTKCSQE